jgi:hypothetical protein
MLEDASAGSDIVVTSRGEISRPGGCPDALANVQRAGEDRFLVSLEVTPVEGRDGGALRRGFVRDWESITDDESHDSRAETLEHSLVAVHGLEGASVTGRCSVTEATCRYWILTGDWLIDAQVLYFGRVNNYAQVAGLGDELLLDFGTLLGEVMGTGEKS